MKLKVRYENKFEQIELTVEEENQLWVCLELEDIEVTQEEKERMLQEKFDIDFNRPEYNERHRETRYLGKAKVKRMDGKSGYIVSKKDDDSFDAFDLMGAIDPTEEYISGEEFDEEIDVDARTEEKIKEFLYSIMKPAQAEMVFALGVKKMTQKEYANLIGDKENNVSKRYGRIKKKIKKLYDKTSFLNALRGL